ncbi:MAG: hypothetical protein WEA34_13215 [Gemmatimonadota bacterium]
MPDRKWVPSTETIVSASAIVAALIALFVGVWENVQERQHNRLSVFPHLELITELATNEEPDSVDRAIIRIINEGVGPAIIDEVRIQVRDQAEDWHIYESWEAAQEPMEGWGVRMRGRVELPEETVMGIGREFSLVTFTAPADSPEGPEHPFFQLLDQLGLVITYHSIYGDEYVSTFGDVE